MYLMSVVDTYLFEDQTQFLSDLLCECEHGKTHYKTPDLWKNRDHVSIELCLFNKNVVIKVSIYEIKSASFINFHGNWDKLLKLFIQAKSPLTFIRRLARYVMLITLIISVTPKPCVHNQDKPILAFVSDGNMFN